MRTYTCAKGSPPGRVAPSSRADLVRLTSISDADERRDLDDDITEEDGAPENDLVEVGGLSPIM